ncbi:CBO0543 family protein [Halobacillus sp. Marseille-P3879]|uniref:CBO0543 family protein n=1 Tax=Halobacillus sp. Marseille-P3879 TaxID=2045014 RepID=UPI000C7A9BD1|nr:CBO0543 family protein [Halobacillus sp. Marseille-P3879]
MTETYEKIRNMHEQLTEMRYDYWISYNVFTFQWWLLLIVLIIPWIVWWKLVDKRRLNHILLFGTILMIFIIMLDDFGLEQHLWSYPYLLTSVPTRLLPVDQGIMIVAHMLVYQYFPRWKKFIIANAVMAVIFTFIFEPLSVWLGIYQLENWRHIYSLPIYFLKVVLIKWLVDEVILKKVLYERERRSNDPQL